MRSQSFRFEKLEPRHLLAAAPLGATPLDTGEFLLGTVAVTPVFFDSTGQTDPKTQNWSSETNGQGLNEIDQVMQRINQGLDWWVDTLDSLNTPQTLEFQVDRTFVDTPFPTQFEPIDRNGSEFSQYVTEFIVDQGYGDAASIEDGVRRFNDDQRALKGTDWAFTIFIVDASDDLDDMFATGFGHRGAFAFAGGLFAVVPSTRSAATIAHEVGHVFWARDEYVFGASYEDRRGYYDSPTLNAADNPADGFVQEISIMRGFTTMEQAFEQNVSPASTLAIVGWQDSDGDGIFDLLDVPLDFDATGYFDVETSEYRLVGTASAVPLLNQNSSGPQSDITLNRVSQIQYRLDGGNWIDAATPDQQQVEFDISLTIDTPFDTIQWRVRDSRIGITSPILSGTRLIPALAPSSVSGLAFVDTDASGQRDGVEELLETTTIVIRNGDGSPLFSGQVDPDDYDDGFLPESLPGVTIAVVGEDLHPNAGLFTSADAGDQRVLYSYDPFLNRWSDAWSDVDVFGAEFDQPVGQVTIDVIGIRDGGYGRLEAFNAQGELVARATTDSLSVGETETLTLTDPESRIVRIKARGFANTIVALSRLSFGVADTYVTDPTGSWNFQNLSDGQYIAQLVPERVIHQFASPTINIEVSGGSSEMIMANATRVDSIRYNAQLPEDVTGIDGVTALDALVIINDLARNSQRILGPDETEGFNVDVNNDGMVSALDALLVVNYLGRETSGSGESEAGIGSNSSKSAPLLNYAAQGVYVAQGIYTGRTTPIESVGSIDADSEDRDSPTVVGHSVADSPAIWPPRESTEPIKFAFDGADNPADAKETDSLEAWQREPGPQFGPEFEEPFAGYAV